MQQKQKPAEPWHRLYNGEGYGKVEPHEAEGHSVSHKHYGVTLELEASDLVTAVALFHEVRRVTSSAGFPTVKVLVTLEVPEVKEQELKALDGMTEVSTAVRLADVVTEGIYYLPKGEVGGG